MSEQQGQRERPHTQTRAPPEETWTAPLAVDDEARSHMQQGKLKKGQGGAAEAASYPKPCPTAGFQCVLEGSLRWILSPFQFTGLLAPLGYARHGQRPNPSSNKRERSSPSEPFDRRRHLCIPRAFDAQPARGQAIAAAAAARGALMGWVSRIVVGCWGALVRFRSSKEGRRRPSSVGVDRSRSHTSKKLPPKRPPCRLPRSIRSASHSQTPTHTPKTGVCESGA